MAQLPLTSVEVQLGSLMAEQTLPAFSSVYEKTGLRDATSLPIVGHNCSFMDLSQTQEKSIPAAATSDIF